MKSNFYKFISIGLVFLPGSLLYGYADVHHSTSELPAVDIYMYQVGSPDDAKKQHKDYAKWAGIPASALDIMDKVRGVTAPAAEALGTATAGVTVAVQAGADLGVPALRTVYEELITPKRWGELWRTKRGNIDALHRNVPKGNKGRGAEWKNNKPMYAIVTLPGTLVPLHERPAYVSAGGILGLAVKSEEDTTDPSKRLYTVDFNPKYNSEYAPAK